MLKELKNTLSILSNKKIIDNYYLIIVNFKVINIILKKLYEKYTSVQVVKNKLKSNPYKCLCGISRIGFKIADSLLLK